MIIEIDVPPWNVVVTLLWCKMRVYLRCVFFVAREENDNKVVSVRPLPVVYWTYRLNVFLGGFYFASTEKPLSAFNPRPGYWDFKGPGHR